MDYTRSQTMKFLADYLGTKHSCMWLARMFWTLPQKQTTKYKVVRLQQIKELTHGKNKNRKIEPKAASRMGGNTDKLSVTGENPKT